MRFLLINRYFGDTQTPTARMLGDVAAELLRLGHQVDVISSSSSYLQKADHSSHRSTPEPLAPTVHRIVTPKKWPRIFQWLWFHAVCLIKQITLPWDRVVYLTDPPFLTSHYPFVRLFKPHTNAYLWSMDLYPEALSAANMLRRQSRLYRFLHALNDWSFGFLSGVIILGECQEKRLLEYPNFRLLPQGQALVPPWDSRTIHNVAPSENFFLKAHPDLKGKSILLYAGNLGAGHRIEEIIQLAHFLENQGNSKWRLVFAVRGQKVKALEQRTQGLSLIKVMDYVSEDMTDHLLSAASVHLITMEHGWEGVIVPSKLYGCLKTGRPILFIGPHDSGTANEIRNLGAGIQVSANVSPEILAEKLEEIGKVTFTSNNLHTRSTDAVCRFLVQ